MGSDWIAPAADSRGSPELAAAAQCPAVQDAAVLAFGARVVVVSAVAGRTAAIQAAGARVAAVQDGLAALGPHRCRRQESAVDRWYFR